ncbi:MAG: UDP-3-O-acyl-N-acetylglucosamine deacetylase, partial [Bradyrhizobiaceae bacterium]|nr:UDP-3-O-acyl-N-acetylglucosamine deacetylase [Bradyrhizobiaceae bacterium]
IADPTAWTVVEAPAPQRVRAHADMAAGLVAPVYGAEVS